ncbi:MAG: hypothetical protein Q9M14_05475 [Mariprofundaceae bacterium]|nr:hypothetical protein [Mariprofundaceae bacterium]
MGLKNILAAASVVLLLCSFSSQAIASNNTTSLDISSNNEALKDFIPRSVIAFWSSPNTGRKILNIAVANYYDMKFESFFGMPTMPPEGKSYFLIQLMGEKPGKKESSTFMPGTYTFALDNNNDGVILNHIIVMTSHSKPLSSGSITSMVVTQRTTLAGEKSVQTKELKGSIELLEISESHAKGKLVYAEPGATLNLDFDVEIE